jgi:hypothetical protein
VPVGRFRSRRRRARERAHFRVRERARGADNDELSRSDRHVRRAGSEASRHHTAGGTMSLLRGLYPAITRRDENR